MFADRRGTKPYVSFLEHLSTVFFGVGLFCFVLSFSFIEEWSDALKRFRQSLMLI
jgi:hypothetical protein